MSFYSEDEIKQLTDKQSVLDYFFYLDKKGVVKFDKKTGRDYYFLSDNNKFSVTDLAYYDFKTGQGGKLLKAIMTIENKSWKEALDFLKEFSNVEINTERKNRIKETETKPLKVLFKVKPNNSKLLQYFNERGISNDVLHQYTKQVHYKMGDRNFFGIGIENQSGGYEIRNPYLKSKLGNNDISVLQGRAGAGIIVFEGMTDMLSFLQLQKDNNRQNNRTLVVMNSIVNLDKLTNYLENQNEKKVFLCLDGDVSGNQTTHKILEFFKEDNYEMQDIRPFYQINETENKDLNDYLKAKITKFELTKENKLNNETRQQRISETKSVGRKSSDQNIDQSSEKAQSVESRDNSRGSTLGSDNVRDGLTTTDEHRTDDGRGGPINRTQQENVEKEKGIEHSLGGVLNESTSIHELDKALLTLRNSKPNNEQIAAIVQLATYVDSDNKVRLVDNLNITKELLDVCNQYKSGGELKEGRGILDEYYTEHNIVDTIRNLVSKLPLQNKPLQVLEPSLGTGNFLLLPKSLPMQSFVTAYEINPITAGIAKLLHPETDINLNSFETLFIKENGEKYSKDTYSERYDLVIGNPPYGEHRGYYKGLGEEPKIARYEDYFVKRSLDVLKEDGVLAMVLPSGWLNRQRKLNDAELLNAYRLPEGAFQGTQVGTDIIILQKNSKIRDLDISNYFEVNSTKILGDIKERTNRFGRLEQYVQGDINEALNKLEKLESQKQVNQIGNLFESYFRQETPVKKLEPKFEKDEKKDSDLVVLRDDVNEKVNVAIETLEAIKFKSRAISDKIDKFNDFKTKAKNYSIDQLKEIEQNADLIIKNHKSEETEYLVQHKPDIKKNVLKYQFKKNDEIVDSSIHNDNEIDTAYLNSFKDTDYNGVLSNVEEHKKYANYVDGLWVHDFYYTEGNIYEKLDQLEIDFEDKQSEQYLKQKSLLENVLPEPKELKDIIISPNHEFVHKFSIGMIDKEVYDYKNHETKIETMEGTLAEGFKEFIRQLPSEAFSGSSAWEVREFVDNQTVTGSDKERNQLVRERRKHAANDLFKKYLHEELSEELRSNFVKEFNRNYNNIHVPDYRNFPLFSQLHKNFKGSPLRLTEVQKAGIGRLTTKGVGLLAHEVGFGKTLSGILSMHEAMERGTAKRPLIVVPNESILKQWVETIFETIPNAKVNVLGNLGKQYDLSKFDNKDGEISIVTYSGFNNIGFSKEITEEMASKFTYISTNETSQLTNSTRDNEIELQKEKEVEGKMKRGKVYDWEDFGFDHLTFDEVHNANHIVGKVRIEDRRFASDFRSQNQQTSKLGINTWMAAQYIQKQNDGRNVTLLSATPFTNKPLEYYSILSLIANNRLEDSGYFNVNNFFETFMEADNEMEIDAKGSIKSKTNVRRFKNNSLFQQLLSEFIDIKGEEDNPELVRPNRINKEYKIEQNDLTEEQYVLLNESFSEEEPGAILSHILNARLIAISPYLSPYYVGDNPTLKEFVENSPKLHHTMELIRQNKKDIPNSGQIIYSELAVAQFPKLKDYLIAEVGYKPNEVEIITGATSKAKRISIQNDFNSGKIKVVIGSEAIQEGMNLQENTSDIYMLSLPYNFTSLRQVEGRAWRQGNRHENVRINYMLTNDSIDVFMLQKLQSKQARYIEAIKSGANILDISDINTQELKTSIITNPVTRAEIEIELIKKKLDYEKNKHLADSAFVLRKHKEYLEVYSYVERAENDLNRIKEYSKEEGVNQEYWIKQIPQYEAAVNAAKEKVSEKLIDLEERGVNVTEIETQNELTEEKLTEIEAKIEDLPNLKEELIAKYTLEKEESLRQNLEKSYVAEREKENKELFIENIEKEMTLEVAEPKKGIGR